MSEEIRWYKGRYKVKVILKSKGNWKVEALEAIPLVPSTITFGLGKTIFEGETFVTVPRLLWKHPKEVEQ